MRRSFHMASLCLIASVILISSCSKKVEPPKDESINGPTVSSNIWENGTYGDTWVNANFSSTNPGMLLLGDETVINWEYKTYYDPNNGLTLAAPANFLMSFGGQNRVIPRGMSSAGFSTFTTNSIIDSAAKKYKRKVNSVIVLTSSELYNYNGWAGNLWTNGSALQSRTKAMAYKLKGDKYFRTQKIGICGLAYSPWSGNWFTSINIQATNASMKAWCDSSLTDNIVFVDIQPAIGGGITTLPADWGDNILASNGKWPSTAGLPKVANRIMNSGPAGTVPANLAPVAVIDPGVNTYSKSTGQLQLSGHLGSYDPDDELNTCIPVWGIPYNASNPPPPTLQLRIQCSGCWLPKLVSPQPNSLVVGNTFKVTFSIRDREGLWSSATQRTFTIVP